jgi:hypothetical protein
MCCNNLLTSVLYLMWHVSIVVRCLSTAVTLKGPHTLPIWHICVISMINSHDFAKRHQSCLDNGSTVYFL